MKSVQWFAALAIAAAISTPAPALLGAEVRLIAETTFPPTPPEPAPVPRFRAVVEGISRLEPDRGRFILSTAIVRHRLQNMTGMTPAQAPGSAIDIEITRGPDLIASFRLPFGLFIVDEDNAFERNNGQAARLATWEFQRRTANGVLVFEEGGTATIFEEAPGHPGIPAVQTGDLVTFTLIKFVGTPNEIAAGSTTATFSF